MEVHTEDSPGTWPAQYNGRENVAVGEAFKVHQ